jgi:hypothetical protein
MRRGIYYKYVCVRARVLLKGALDFKILVGISSQPWDRLVFRDLVISYIFLVEVYLIKLYALERELKILEHVVYKIITIITAIIIVS